MSDPVIDPESIAALNSVSPGDGGAFLRELIDIFLADTPARLEEISRSLATQDLPTMTRAAHSIKGSAGNFGARRLVAAAWDLEQSARAGNLEASGAQLPVLRDEFDRVRAAMETLRVT